MIDDCDAVGYAVGSIKETYKKYPNSRKVLPAMGYGPKQIKELEETIDATPCDLVVSGTPIDLSRILKTSLRLPSTPSMRPSGAQADGVRLGASVLMP